MGYFNSPTTLSPRRAAEAVGAVVVSVGLRSRQRGIRLFVVCADDLVNLTGRLLGIEIMYLTLAWTGVREVALSARATRVPSRHTRLLVVGQLSRNARWLTYSASLPEYKPKVKTCQLLEVGPLSVAIRGNAGRGQTWA
jgi:hypothetical protein